MNDLVKIRNPPPPRGQRSMFDRSCGYKTTFDAGGLIPVFFDEVLPGDTFNLRMRFFCRSATMTRPVMDNFYLDSFFFFCPTRLLMDDWERFCGAQDSPNDSIEYLIPRGLHDGSGEPALNSLWNFFGFPMVTSLDDDDAPIVFPFRMYPRVWNEWFRDENIYGSFIIDYSDADLATANLMSIQPRARRSDYFSSCLPWPFKPGLDQVITPILPVPQSGPTFQDGSGNLLGQLLSTSGGNTANFTNSALATGPVDWDDPQLLLDINLFREAWAVQDLLETDARFGTRYVELLRGHWDVISPDFRLQRTEFLGGGHTVISTNPVVATAEGTSTNLGDLAATGTASGQHGFSQSFTEHGYIMGLINVRVEHTYSNMMDRHMTRRTRYDYYWPELANLGEQAVLKRELSCGTAAEHDDNIEVLGYQPRYEEYRYKQSMCTGLFNPRVGTSLDVWHFGEDITVGISLSNFIADTSSVLVDRVIDVPSEPQFLFDSWFDLKCARLMPMFAIPARLGRF